MLRGKMNCYMTKVHSLLLGAGFMLALRERTVTHREGSQLDQIWTRNIAILNEKVAAPIDQMSEHCLIQIEMKAVIMER